MKTDDLIKYALLGLGVYIVWQYVLVPMFNSTVIVPTSIPPLQNNVLTPISTTTPVITAPVVTAPVITAPVPVTYADPLGIQVGIGKLRS